MVSLGMRLRGASAFLIASALGCGESDEATVARQPDGFADALALPSPVDENPDPHILEVTLVAEVTPIAILDGTTTDAWTYNGSLPGPLLRLRAGDRLIVHFRNELPEPSTVHWHGIRLPNAMDGSPPHTQEPVPPGGSFDYDFVVPDPGLFWYHPHWSSAAQVGFGLYGGLLVDPAPEDPAGLGDEVVMVLSDIAIDEEGAFQPTDLSGDIGTLFGREGGVLLVNGRVRPTLRAQNGLRQRWRIVNAAKSRYYLLTLPGHDFTRIGGDTGLLAAPITSEEILLPPGTRADVVVRPTGAVGDSVALTWNAFDRGWGTSEFRDPVPLVDVVIEGDAVDPGPLPALGGGASPLSATGAVPVNLHLTQGVDREGGLVLGIDGVPFWESEPLMAHPGETQLWTLTNDMDYAHPIHLHGFFFQEVDEAGTPLEPLEWKDTSHVPQNGVSRFLVKYDDRVGMWMFHCHILDHADAGMMGMIHLMHH